MRQQSFLKNAAAAVKFTHDIERKKNPALLPSLNTVEKRPTFSAVSYLSNKERKYIYKHRIGAVK